MITQIVIISLVSSGLAIVLARRLGLLDQPGGRKLHARAVPLAGGIAIFTTLALSHQLLAVPVFSDTAVVVISLVFLLGVYDDARHLGPGLRLLLHYAAGAVLATWGSVVILNVGNLLAFGNIPLLLLAVPLTALSFAGLSNAYNMIDGIDGLAAGLTLIPLGVLYALTLDAQLPMGAAMLPPLVATAVFLLFNLGPDKSWLPKMFLGDGGSVTLGFLVTASLVYFSQGANAVIKPVSALWLVTVPLMDMLATMLNRARHGKRVMDADRGHLHLLLVDLGWRTRAVLATLLLYALGCAGLGLFLERIPAYLSLLTYFVLFAVHCTVTARIGRQLTLRADEDGA